MAPVVVHEQIALWVLFPETVKRMLSNALNLQMLAAVDLRWREVRNGPPQIWWTLKIGEFDLA